MKTNAWRSRIRDELIIEVWEALDCESVGARELVAIQQAVHEVFGSGAVVSPASIARTLADEGAVLRHPEVLKCDTKWREHNLSTSLSADDLNFSDLEKASESIKKLDEQRKGLAQSGNKDDLRRLRELALHSKTEAQRIARSKIFDEKKRAEAREIAQWLTVWLQEPDLFADWLVLRRSSPEFSKLTER